MTQGRNSLVQHIVEQLDVLSEHQLAEMAAHVSRLRTGLAPEYGEARRDLLDQLPILIGEFTAQGAARCINSSWRSYFGSSEVLTVQGWQSLVHPDDVPLTRPWDTFRSGHSVDALEIRLLRFDGVYRWFSVSLRAIPDLASNVNLWIITATDIHATKQEEQMLRVEREWMQLALRAGRSGVWDYTPSTGHMHWDDGCCAACGVGKETAMDFQCFVRRLHPEDSARVQELMNAALASNGNGVFEAEYRTVGVLDGAVRNIHSEGRAIFIGEGSKRVPVRLVGVLTDVTTRVRAAEELRQANLDLQQFAFAAAHDLQEPLRNISLSLGFLKLAHGTDMDEAALKLVDTSIEGARRIHGMITDLLAFTKVTNETPAGIAIPVDSNRVLKDVQTNLQSAIAGSGAEIRSEPLPPLAVLETHLQQLFQNIVGNSIKYRRSDRSPVIEVTAERQLDGWRIAVADNGIGFDEVHQERIFGVFKRLHHRHEYPGSGIGLAICSRIVASYGGRIWARAKVNEGATIFFTLPA